MKPFFKTLTRAALACLALSAPAAAQQTQSSWLSVSGGQLKDSCGTTIVMRGVNHGNVWASNWGIDELPQIAMTGGNTVRLCFERTYTSWATGAPVTMNTTAAQVENVIQACLAQQMIPVLELHDWTNYDANNTATQTLPQATAWWTSATMLPILKKYQHWLVLNPANEPEHWDMTEAAYLAANNTAVTALRNAGLSCPIMIDGMHWGQDHQFFLNNGAAMLNSDPQHKLIFSVHAYWENETDAVVTSRMNAIGTSGLPFVIGELAKNNSGDAATTINYQLIMAKCQQYSIGYLGWWWGFVNAGSNNGLSFTGTGMYADLADFGYEIAVGDPNSIEKTAVKSTLLATGICAATSITLPSPGESKTGLRLALTPNPTQGDLVLRFAENTATVHIRVSNLQGQTVFSEARRPHDQTLELHLNAALPAGVYLLHCQSETGSTALPFVLRR